MLPPESEDIGGMDGVDPAETSEIALLPPENMVDGREDE